MIFKEFKIIESNYLIFVNERTHLIVSVYVNNIQILGLKGSRYIANLKKKLYKKFVITNLDLYLYYLGMKIQRDRMTRIVRITQTTYLKKVLARFKMTLYVLTSTPIIIRSQLQVEVINKITSQVIHEYQSIIESVIYSIIQTRPDICYAVTMLSRYNQNPNATHIQAAKRVIRYLKGILDYNVFYNTSDGLEGFTDTN